MTSLVHDVAIQNLPVRFIIDRAGLVGADGATHGGVFDLAYLSCLPNMMIACPSDEAELVHMMATIHDYDDGPSALRFPRGEGRGIPMPDTPIAVPVGKGRILQQGRDIAILSLGTILEEAEKAGALLKAEGYSVTIADARFAKPFDKDLIRQLISDHDALLVVEEASPGGFSAHLMQYCANEGLLSRIVRYALHISQMTISTMTAKTASWLAKAGIDAAALVEKAKSILPSAPATAKVTNAHQHAKKVMPNAC